MSDFYDAGVAACPSCGRADFVTAVPAVYLSGRDSVQVRVPARGDQPAHTETRQVTSALAHALAPAPPNAAPNNQVFGGLGGMLLIPSAVAFGIAASSPSPSDGMTGNGGMIGSGLPGAGTSGSPDLSWLGWLSGFGLLVAATLIVTAMVRGAAHRGRLTGRARAEALWSRAWYCARCATTHFRPGPEDPSRPLSLVEFRLLVWGAGGYGDLASKYPVVRP